MALSSITNGRLHLRHKDGGVDGRSAGARRFKDLIRSFSADFGGYERLSEADRSAVRQAATLTMRAEQLQADVVNGERIDPDELIRLTSESRRCLRGIKRSKPSASVQSKLLQAHHASQAGLAS